MTALLESGPEQLRGIRLLKSELAKIISTRMVIVLGSIAIAAGIVASVIFGLIGVFGGSDGTNTVFEQTEFVASSYTFGNQMARIVAIIAGAMAMGAEYRHKTLATSYLAVPRRRDLIVGKGIVTFGYGLALGLVSTIASFIVTAIFVLTHHGSLALGTAQGWQALLMNVLTIGLWCLIGYGLGLLVRQMIASVVIAIVFSYVVEPIVSLIFTVKRWTVPGQLLPSGATDNALGVTAMRILQENTGGGWPAWSGIGVLVGWALIPTVIGCLVTVRRDIE